MTACPVCQFSFDAAKVPDGMCPRCLPMAAGDAVTLLAAAPWQPPSVEKVRELLPGYEVEEMIGRGGMGAVYKARQPALDRVVAVKVAPGRKDPKGAGLAKRFENEARVLGRLQHPNIMPVHELGMDAEGQSFYTMKLVKGRTLQAILDDLREAQPATVRHYPLAGLLTIFGKVCDALAFAHSQGVLHRDLKPENIMVGEFGEVLVLDWGLAKLMAEEEPQAEHAFFIAGYDLAMAITQDGDVVGTPQFMSPEQAEGRVSELDERSDVFALGAILYAILTLRPPVDGLTAAAVLKQVREGGITPPAQHASSMARRRRERTKGEPEPEMRVPGKAQPHCPGGRVPEAISAVAMKALQQRRGQRYQSVADLQADVEAFSRGFATSAEGAKAWRLLQLFVLRHRAVSAALGLAVVALLTGAAVSAWQWHKGDLANEGLRKELRVSTAQRLAAGVMAEMDRSPREAVRLAVEAVETTRAVDGTVRPSAQSALYEVMAGVAGFALLVPCAERVGFAVEERGGWIAGGRMSGEIDVAGGPEGQSTLRRHGGAVRALAWLGRGRLLSGDEDGLVCEWVQRGGGGLQLQTERFLQPPKPGHSLCAALASSGGWTAAVWVEQRDQNRLAPHSLAGAVRPDLDDSVEAHVVLVLREEESGAQQSLTLPFRVGLEVEFARSGGLLMVKSRDREVPALVRLDAAAQRWQSLTLPPDLPSPVHDAALSPSGRWLALTSGDRHTRLVGLHHDMAVLDLGSQRSIPEQVAFSRDERWLSMMTRHDGLTRLHAVPAGPVGPETPLSGWQEEDIHGRSGTESAFTADGSWLIATGGRRCVHAVQVAPAGQVPASLQLRGPDSDVRLLHVGTTGSEHHIISGHVDGGAWRWPFPERAVVVSPRRILKGDRSVTWMSVTPERDRLVMTSKQRLMVLPMAELDLPATGTATAKAATTTLPERFDRPHGTVHPDGKRVALGTQSYEKGKREDGLLLDLASGQVLENTSWDPGRPIHSMAYDSDGFWLGSSVRLLRWLGDSAPKSPIRQDISVRALVAEKTSRWVAVASAWDENDENVTVPGGVHWLDLQPGASGEWVDMRPWPTWPKSNVSLLVGSPDGRWLAAAGSLPEVLLFDMHAAQPLAHPQRQPIGTGAVRSLSFSPDSQMLAIISDLGQPHLWRVNEPHGVMMLPPVHQAQVVTFGRTSDELLTTDERGSLWRWELNVALLIEQARRYMK